MFTMLIDHIGIIWYSDNQVWRIIGRLSLPLYAYAIVIGYSRTSDIQRYLKRTALLALLSQIPFQLAFDTWSINVIATLFICLLLLWLLDHYQQHRIKQISFTIAAIMLLELFPFDYGAYALVLVLLYRYARVSLLLPLHLILNLGAFLAKGWTLQLFSLFATIIIVYLPDFLREMDRIRIPRLIWRSFYPVHLVILALLNC